MASLPVNFKVFLVMWVILECSLRSFSDIYVPLHWTHSNPLFKSSKSSSNSSILRLNVLPKSQLNIICPHPALNLVKVDQTPDKDQMFENLWVVDKQSYDTCTVNQSIKSNRILMECEKPLLFKLYPLVFLEVSPSKQVMEFKKGKDYYFISTSDGYKSSLKNKKDGHCKTASMKFIIHVCLNDQDPLCKDPPPTTLPPPTPPPTTPKRTTLPTTLPTTQKPTKTSQKPVLSTRKMIRTLKPHTEITTEETIVNSDVSKRDKQANTKTKTTAKGTPDMEAAKNKRTAADIARDATWFILMAVMGALLVVSLSCNLYSICVRNKQHRRADTTEDKRSSAIHTLLRENSRVDRV